MAWRLHLAYRTGISVRRLPPHISLKQPFDIDSIDAIEEFAETFGHGLKPPALWLTGYHLWELPESKPHSSVLSVLVEETTELRELHNRLNHELSQRFGQRQADFNGDAFAFHLTIAAASGLTDIYRQAFEECSQSPFSPWAVEARELALFLYERQGTEDWQYATYKVLPMLG